MRIEFVIEQLKIDKQKLVDQLQRTIELCHQCEEIKENELDKDLICKIDSIDVEIARLCRELKCNPCIDKLPMMFKVLLLVIISALAYKLYIS